MKTDPQRDRFLLRECYIFASKYSHDPRTQNAAMIVRGTETIALAANTVPLPLSPKNGRTLPGMKDHYIEHAERAAIYQAASAGIRLCGTTMYCPWAAGASCARAIISCGIAEVVTHAAPYHLRPGWAESIEEAERMLGEAGIVTRVFATPIGGCEIRFNGELVKP